MKKNYSLFIAGPTEDSREERECLKILANDLNSEYRAQELHINAMSYRNFDDNQERYNDFIKNEADLAFFVLKGGIGEKTLEEFITAAEAWRAKKLPEIVVFLHRSADNNSAEIGKIYGLMEGLLNKQYPIRYNSLEELRAEAKLRIGRHIQKWLNEPKSRITESVLEKTTPKQEQKDFANSSVPNSICRHRMIWMICIAVVLIGGLFLWKNFLYRPKPLILFAGGGSVVQYINNNNRNTDSTDIIDGRQNYIYLRMPSSHSWTLLSEEVNRKVLIDDESENRFFPISLSADEAPDSIFVKACTEEEFKEKAVIVSCYLGEDSLALYVSKCLSPKIMNEKIGIKEKISLLINLAREKKIQILHTTSGSGTLRTWQSYMSSRDSAFLESDSSTIFNEISNPKIIIDKLPLAIFGSKYYSMRELKDSPEYKIDTIYLSDRNRSHPASKPIILYFAAYRDNPQENIYWIPKEIMSFLKKLNIPKEVWTNKKLWDSRKGLIRGNGKIVIHLTERPEIYRNDKKTTKK